jgi:hypothetical protein
MPSFKKIQEDQRLIREKQDDGPQDRTAVDPHWEVGHVKVKLYHTMKMYAEWKHSSTHYYP